MGKRSFSSLLRNFSIRKRHKKSKMRPEDEEPPSYIMSLPDDIIIDIFARVSRRDYPTLSLVSKHFHSLVYSPLGYTNEKKIKCCFSTKEADGHNWGNNYETILVMGFDSSHPRHVIKIALRKHFGSSCGEVIRVFVPIECETGARLGFAFINLEDENEIKKALELNGSCLEGKKLEVMMAKDKVGYFRYPYPNFKGCESCRARRMRCHNYLYETHGGRIKHLCQNYLYGTRGGRITRPCQNCLYGTRGGYITHRCQNCLYGTRGGCITHRKGFGFGFRKEPRQYYCCSLDWGRRH